jgi:hypothetical protein
MSRHARPGQLKRDHAAPRGRGHAPTVYGRYDRGREADNPADIPPLGWKDVLWRV